MTCHSNSGLQLTTLSSPVISRAFQQKLVQLPFVSVFSGPVPLSKRFDLSIYSGRISGIPGVFFIPAAQYRGRLYSVLLGKSHLQDWRSQFANGFWGTLGEAGCHSMYHYIIDYPFKSLNPLGGTAGTDAPRHTEELGWDRNAAF